jgi:hypothetical protein
MQTRKIHRNNHQIVDYSAVMAAKYGEIGSPERNAFECEALAAFEIEDSSKVRKRVTSPVDKFSKTAVRAM